MGGSEVVCVQMGLKGSLVTLLVSDGIPLPVHPWVGLADAEDICRGDAAVRAP